MTTRLATRLSVRLAGALIGAALVAMALPSGRALAEAAEPFQPPEGPMLLTRTIRKPLSGGLEAVVTRRYEVRFVRDGEGFRVDGTLIDVAVTVPPRLDAIAEIERSRPDEGMFPLRLDAAGRLRDRGAPRPGQATQAMVDAVAARLDRVVLGAYEKAQAKAFVLGFRERPGTSVWPDDLFRPAPGLRRDERVLPLVDGMRGRIVTAIEASAALPGGLMSEFTRTVTSELDDELRIVTERWTLAPRVASAP